jgi:cytoskeletal protein CcmA (bactofilin family)
MSLPKPFRERRSGNPTVIGADSVFVGNLRGDGPFIVFGQVQGDGELGGDLNLAVNGQWLGNIRARHAVVAGRILGSLQVEGRLEIAQSAVIRGGVRARTIAIATGAIIDGEIEVTSAQPVMQLEDAATAAA